MDDYFYCAPVHKDFHIVFNDLIKIVKDTYGAETLKDFFKDRSVYMYMPLINRIKKYGFIEIKNHLEKIFTAEGGKFNLEYNTDFINFRVHKCPAINHLKENNLRVDKDFCMCSTDIVNRAIAEECNYNFDVKYNLDEGQCVQRFWK